MEISLSKIFWCPTHAVTFRNVQETWKGYQIGVSEWASCGIRIHWRLGEVLIRSDDTKMKGEMENEVKQGSQEPLAFLEGQFKKHREIEDTQEGGIHSPWSVWNNEWCAVKTRPCYDILGLQKPVICVYTVGSAPKLSQICCVEEAWLRAFRVSFWFCDWAHWWEKYHFDRSIYTLVQRVRIHQSLVWKHICPIPRYHIECWFIEWTIG